MRIGVPREIQPGETRVALTPQSLPLLARDGHDVMIERGAGAAAHFPDAAYVAGANCGGSQALFDQSDVILKVQPLGYNPSTERHEAEMLPSGRVTSPRLAGAAHPS